MIKKKMTYNWANWNFSDEIQKDIKEKEEQVGRRLSKDEVIRHLFGSWDDKPSTTLDLYLLRKQKTTRKHRLNHLWVYPLTLVLAPFRYVLYGDIGWTNKTKLGKFLFVACGYDKGE